jgi:hypothetical protein
MNKTISRILIALSLIFGTIACSLFSSIGERAQQVQGTAAAVATGAQDGEYLLATAQAAVTQVQGSDLAQTAQAAVTELGESGLAATIQAVITSEGPEIQQTLQAFATESGPDMLETAQAYITEQGPGLVETAQSYATQLASSSGEPPDDIPIIDRDTVQDLQVLESLVSYNTSLDFDSVVEFYKTEMPDNGWVKVDEGSFESDAATMLNFTKDARNVSVVMNALSSDQIYVLISIQGK